MQTSRIAYRLNGAEVAMRGSRVGDFAAETLAPALRRFGATVVAWLRSRRDDVIASRYEGCSWGDATERQMTGEIVDRGFTRF